VVSFYGEVFLHQRAKLLGLLLLEERPNFSGNKVTVLLSGKRRDSFIGTDNRTVKGVKREDWQDSREEEERFLHSNG
jgi:hypothetical protein